MIFMEEFIYLPKKSKLFKKIWHVINTFLREKSFCKNNLLITMQKIKKKNKKHLRN